MMLTVVSESTELTLYNLLQYIFTWSALNPSAVPCNNMFTEILFLPCGGKLDWVRGVIIVLCILDNFEREKKRHYPAVPDICSITFHYISLSSLQSSS